MSWWDTLKGLASQIPDAWKESAKEAAGRPERPATERLGTLAAQVPVTSPQLVSEKIGSILRDELAALQILPADQYGELTRALVRGMARILDRVRVFWDGHPLYIEDLHEVWICCQPPLELVEGRVNSLNVLLAQLQVESVTRIIYFLGKDDYVQNLKQLLSSKEILPRYQSRLAIARIPEDQVLDHPIVLYRSVNEQLRGVRGLFHPRCKPILGGMYDLEVSLPKDWLAYLDQGQAREAHDCLKPHAPSPQGGGNPQGAARG